jgi:hypothetical protein
MLISVRLLLYKFIDAMWFLELLFILYITESYYRVGPLLSYMKLKAFKNEGTSDYYLKCESTHSLKALSSTFSLFRLIIKLSKPYF